MAESEEELKSLLMRVKEESKKPGLKLNIQKTKIMVSDPITSQKIERVKVETVTDFLFLGSKITADGDCSLEIRRHLLLGRKAMTNLDRILKSRDITWPNKLRQNIKKQRHHMAKQRYAVKAMVFSSSHKSWTIKKAECWRIYAFKLWCWRRLLRIPLSARISSQSILK